MTEADFLKVLWFVAGTLLSTSVYAANDTSPREQRMGYALAVMALFIAAYVVARSVWIVDLR